MSDAGGGSEVAGRRVYEHAARLYDLIVGEALNRVPPEMQRLQSEIPWDAIRGLRNRLVHAYWRVDLEIVEHAVAEDLPELVSKIDRLIEDTK